MPQMVRKQIYIQKSQEERLKKIAESRGVSEAEIIRRALENELKRSGNRLPMTMMPGEGSKPGFPKWISSRLSRKKSVIGSGTIYEERMKRYDRNPD